MSIIPLPSLIPKRTCNALMFAPHPCLPHQPGSSFRLCRITAGMSVLTLLAAEVRHFCILGSLQFNRVQSTWWTDYTWIVVVLEIDVTECRRNFSQSSTSRTTALVCSKAGFERSRAYSSILFRGTRRASNKCPSHISSA